jgi:molybdopterin synthase catalytic subunit
MTLAEVDTGITDSPIDVTAAIASASSIDAGAVGVFIGTVRESAAVRANESKAVVRLDYEAHPDLAAARLDEIARDAADKWGLLRIVAWHRTGACELGEPTVVVACSAPHRADALEACRHVIDTLKATVPIWKREVYADGSSWVGAEGDGA